MRYNYSPLKFLLIYLKMIPVNKKSSDYISQKDYIEEITMCLIPHVKEKTIAEMIVNTSLNIEKQEIIKQVKETVKHRDGSFDKIHNTLKMLCIVLENNTDLKMKKMREDTKRLLKEMVKCFDNKGMNYFQDYNLIKEQNEEKDEIIEELNCENEHLKSMLERYNIVDIDDMPSDTDM